MFVFFFLFFKSVHRVTAYAATVPLPETTAAWWAQRAEARIGQGWLEKNIAKYLQTIDKFLKNRVEIILGGGHKINFPDFKNIGNVKFVSSFEEFDKMLIELK